MHTSQPASNKGGAVGLVGLVGLPLVVPAVPGGGTGTISISPVPPAHRQAPPLKNQRAAVPAKTTFALTLEALPDSYGPAAPRRLKRFLKAALRAYGLRCVEAREFRPHAGPLAARVASDLTDPPEALPELLTYRPASWELPTPATDGSPRPAATASPARPPSKPGGGNGATRQEAPKRPRPSTVTSTIASTPGRETTKTPGETARQD